MMLNKDKYFMRVVFIGRYGNADSVTIINKGYMETLREVSVNLLAVYVKEICSISFIKSVKNIEFNNIGHLYKCAEGRTDGCMWRRIPKYYINNLYRDFHFLTMANGKKGVILNGVYTKLF